MEESTIGQIRHRSSVTTHVVRGARQQSQTSLAQLIKELSINPKAIAEWRKQATVKYFETAPKEPHSTILIKAEDAMIVAFWRHTLVPLDDCICAIQLSIAHLTHSALN